MIGWLLCLIGRHEWFPVSTLGIALQRDRPVAKFFNQQVTTHVCMRCPARRRVTVL